MIDPLIVVRTIHFASTAMLAGVIFFRFFVAEPLFRTVSARSRPHADTFWRQLSRIAWISLTVAVVSGAVWLMLLAANISGLSVVHALTRGFVWIVATETQFGLVWILRLCLAVVLASLLASLKSDARKRPRPFDWLPVLSATGLLTALAWPGHSGATPGPSGVFYLAADALHLVAAGAWIGSLLPLVLLLARARRSSAPHWTMVASAATRRFSILGIVCVGTLIATGMVNTWNLAGSLPALTDTDYGRLLLLKIALFLAMVCLATINRLRWTPRLAERRAMQQLQRNAAIETSLGFVVIAIVGALGTMPPALHEQHASHWSADAAADAAFVHIHTPTAMAEVTVSPGHAGPVLISVRILREDVTPLPARGVTVVFSMPDSGLEAISRPATKQSEGRWQVDGVTLPQPGVWNVEVGILLYNFDKITLPGLIVIEP